MTSKINTLRSLCCVVMILIGAQLHSQTTGIEADDLEVIKAFEAQLEEAYLVEVKPVIPKVTPINKTYNYKVSIVPLELTYPAPIIKPLAMLETNDFDHFDQYIKLGYGNINNPHGQMQLSFTNGDRYRIRVSGHYTSLDITKNVAHQKMADGTGLINGEYRINENAQVFAEVSTSVVDRNFFGNRAYSDIGQQRDIYTFSNQIGIRNLTITESGINYQAKVGANFIAKKTTVTDPTISYWLDGQIEKRASEHINIVLPMKFNQFLLLPGGVSNEVGRLAFHFEPKIHFQKGLLFAKAGLDGVITGDKGQYYWPEAEIGYGILGQQMQIFVASQQKHTFNDWRQQLSLSPWVDTKTLEVRTTAVQSLFGGIKGELPFVSYQAEAGWSKTINQSLYTNTYSTGTQISNLYDDGTAVFLRGNIDFALSENMNVGGHITQNLYDMKNVNHAWGLPSLESDVYFNYHLIPKVLDLGAQLTVKDAIWTNLTGDILPVLTESKLNNQVELNAKIDWWPTKYVGAYAFGHNLLNTPYQRWFGLPNVGINFGGGLMAKF